jgi:sodium/bile acid cotransporter 7
MKRFLVRRWFLIALGTGVAAAAVFPGAFRPVAWLLAPQVLVAAALYLMSWGLESRSLGRSLLRPLPALWALLLSYGLVPVLAWLAGRLLPGPDDYRVGLLVMASVPCTLASAVLWTRLAGGNEAIALLVIVLGTLTSWLITPLWLSALGGDQAVAPALTKMMRDLLLCLVLPVAAGQLTRLPRPLARAADTYRAPLGVVTQVLILLIMLKAAVDLGERLWDTSGGVAGGLALGPVLAAAAACVGVHLAALACGMGSSRLLGFERPVRIAVAFSCSQKTLPVALLLFETTFRDRGYPLAVLPMLFYHIGQLTADTFIADRLREAGESAKATVAPSAATEGISP